MQSDFSIGLGHPPYPTWPTEWYSGAPRVPGVVSPCLAWGTPNQACPPLTLPASPGCTVSSRYRGNKWGQG